MKIENSTVVMASYRSYAAEAKETQSTTTRRYSGGNLQGATVHAQKVGISQFEVEGGTSVYTTSSAGVSRKDEGSTNYRYNDTQPIKDKANAQENQAIPSFLMLTPSNEGSWVSKLNNVEDSPQIKMLKKMLELLKKFSGKGKPNYDPNAALKTIKAAENSVKFSASASSLSYQEVTAVINGRAVGTGTVGLPAGQSTGTNGVWTRQVTQSGFIAGQENVAFSSTGSVVTSDGRSIDFNITMEMSRSFAAAYEITGEETIYTDPLVINLDTDRASLDDVSFFFDLDADGTKEEISGLNGSSGFLAFDKNGDGQINDGSELFGARTGNGFAELAQYDSDRNGWIDENDAIFDKLSVWVKSGSQDAQLLSLKDAGVGAIFLGSQATNYTLTDSSGEEGAKVRQTGIYLKESGQVGTMQHLDFKA